MGQPEPVHHRDKHLERWMVHHRAGWLDPIFEGLSWIGTQGLVWLVIAAVLALSVSLGAAFVVRLYRVAFLGRPRTPRAAAVTEAERATVTALFALAASQPIGLTPGPPTVACRI